MSRRIYRVLGEDFAISRFTPAGKLPQTPDIDSGGPKPPHRHLGYNAMPSVLYATNPRTTSAANAIVVRTGRRTAVSEIFPRSAHSKKQTRPTDRAK
jgi:hypothetical protein